MTKWEYLVFSTVYEVRPRNNIEVLGYKLNDKKILFEVDSQFARDDVNYDKYHSNGQNQILNELGASSPFFASRTDKGVNATCNIITTTSSKKCKEFVGDFIEKLERYPIWITGYSDVEVGFNPRIANQRKYIYYVFNEEKKELRCKEAEINQEK